MEKTAGIVIKCKDYSETSQLVWLFTKDFGKIKVIAKGSRASVKKFKGKLDLFNLCDIVIYRNPKRELHTLSECDVLEYFSKIRLDLNRLATASYFAELLDASVGLEDPSSEVYSLVVDVLKWLAEGKDPIFLRYIFEIKLMQYLGNLPKINNVSKGVMRILESKAIDKLKVSPSQLEELRKASSLIIDYLIGKRLKSLDFMEEVSNAAKK